MPGMYQVVTYARDLDGLLKPIAERAETTAVAAMSRAGELSRNAEGVAVIALLADGVTQTLARYGDTPPEVVVGQGYGGRHASSDK